MKEKDGNLLRRKNFVILTLVMLLGLIGYVNYSLNQESLLMTSNELESYEMRMMEESGILTELYGEDEYALIESEEEEEVDATASAEKIEGQMDNAIIVDSHDNAVVDVAQETSSNITEQITSQESMQSSIYFIEGKLERDKKRSALVGELDEIVQNQYTSDTVRNEALEMRMQMVSNTEAELLIENMTMAKGFADTIVYLSGDSISIVVQADALTESEVAQIVDIVQRETDIIMDNIVIMNKN